MQATILSLTSADFAGLTHQQIPQLLSPDTRLIIETAPQRPGSTFGESTFNRICWHKAKLIRDTLHRTPVGEWLLYTDADVLFLRPVADLLATLDGYGKPIVAQHDPDTGACAGFMAIKSEAKTWCFFGDLVSYRDDRFNDQIILNQMLANERYQGLHALFPSNVVGSFGNLSPEPALWTDQQFDIPAGLCAFHLNYTIGIEAKLRLARQVLRSFDAPR